VGDILSFTSVLRIPFCALSLLAGQQKWHPFCYAMPLMGSRAVMHHDLFVDSGAI